MPSRDTSVQMMCVTPKCFHLQSQRQGADIRRFLPAMHSNHAGAAIDAHGHGIHPVALHRALHQRRVADGGRADDDAAHAQGKRRCNRFQRTATEAKPCSKKALISLPRRRDRLKSGN